MDQKNLRIFEQRHPHRTKMYQVYAWECRVTRPGSLQSTRWLVGFALLPTIGVDCESVE